MDISITLAASDETLTEAEVDKWNEIREEEDYFSIEENKLPVLRDNKEVITKEYYPLIGCYRSADWNTSNWGPGKYSRILFGQFISIR